MDTEERKSVNLLYVAFVDFQYLVERYSQRDRRQDTLEYHVLAGRLEKRIQDLWQDFGDYEESKSKTKEEKKNSE